jgi:hypothetical protein
LAAPELAGVKAPSFEIIDLMEERASVEWAKHRLSYYNRTWRQAMQIPKHMRPKVETWSKHDSRTRGNRKTLYPYPMPWYFTRANPEFGDACERHVDENAESYVELALSYQCHLSHLYNIFCLKRKREWVQTGVKTSKFGDRLVQLDEMVASMRAGEIRRYQELWDREVKLREERTAAEEAAAASVASVVSGVQSQAAPKTGTPDETQPVESKEGTLGQPH